MPLTVGVPGKRSHRLAEYWSNVLTLSSFLVCSVHSVTLALQTAARLSQQAELGGFVEEIEVSTTTVAPPGGAVVPLGS